MKEFSSALDSIIRSAVIRSTLAREAEENACQLCYGAGWLSTGDYRPGRTVVRCPECEPQRLKDLAQELSARVPERYRIPFDDPRMVSPDASRALPLATPVDSSALITGGLGCGKTTMAAAIILHRISLGAVSSLEFVTFPKLLDSIRSSYGADHTTTLFDRCLSCDQLVIDDLGAASVHDRNAPWVHERMYRLVEERYAWMRPTIYTSNVILDDLISRVGAPVVSRIKEDIGERTLHLVGRDMRHHE